jgi:hypothetical protein
MRRVIGWLCLVAAVSGAFLRQAEAAADIASALAELGDGGSAEEPDGGVGDEPESGLPRAGFCSLIRPLDASDLSGANGLVARASAHRPLQAESMAVRWFRGNTDRPRDAGTRRQAQLGLFLF